MRWMTELPLPTWRATDALTYRWRLLRCTWRAAVAGSITTPLVYVIGFGLGLGSQVSSGQAGEGYGGAIALALVSSVAAQVAATEASYPVLGSFQARTYESMVATSLSVGDLVDSELVWAMLRSLAAACVTLAAAWCTGLVQPAWTAVVVLLVALLGSMAVAAPLVAFTATQFSDVGICVLARFVVVPMTLVSGAFFPIGSLPPVVEEVAWALPLSHATTLVRSASDGQLTTLASGAHVLVLCAYLLVGRALAHKAFSRRLTA